MFKKSVSILALGISLMSFSTQSFAAAYTLMNGFYMTNEKLNSDGGLLAYTAVTGASFLSPLDVAFCAISGAYNDNEGTLYDGKWTLCDGSGIDVSAYGLVTTSLIVLLKEAKAAAPDALNYVAGAAPSPALNAVAEKIQDMSYKINGEEMSFDEAVDDILLRF